jgi:hypothetical protein
VDDVCGRVALEARRGELFNGPMVMIMVNKKDRGMKKERRE